jgi:hypothetical protein
MYLVDAYDSKEKLGKGNVVRERELERDQEPSSSSINVAQLPALIGLTSQMVSNSTRQKLSLS